MKKQQNTLVFSMFSEEFKKIASCLKKIKAIPHWLDDDADKDNEELIEKATL